MAAVIARETPDRADREVVTDGPTAIELPAGPAMRLTQTTLTPSPDGRFVYRFTRLTLCGQAGDLDARFLIRSYCSGGRFPDSLEPPVVDFAQKLEFSEPGAR